MCMGLLAMVLWQVKILTQKRELLALEGWSGDGNPTPTSLQRTTLPQRPTVVRRGPLSPDP